MLCLRIAMSKKSFLANSLTPLTRKPNFTSVTITYGKTIACSFLQNDPQQSPGYKLYQSRSFDITSRLFVVIDLFSFDSVYFLFAGLSFWQIEFSVILFVCTTFYIIFIQVNDDSVIVKDIEMGYETSNLHLLATDYQFNNQFLYIPY